MSSGRRASVAFLPQPLDYGRRLARRRWERAMGAGPSVELLESAPAGQSLRAADDWLVVRDGGALPLPGFRPPRPGRGRVVLPVTRGRFAPAEPHTVRELEAARFEPAPEAEPETAVPALAFSTGDFLPAPEESVARYLERLLSPDTPHERDPGFLVLSLEDPFGRERPEVLSRLPARATRLLDVGCGAGAPAAAARRLRPGLFTVGIERDPLAAQRARGVLDRVLLGDALTELARLVTEGERFDAFLFADVLEHLEDPVAALSRARALALPGATLLASVPNVGHLSVVRDLLLGRFDPAPAGLLDSGHLRWFTRDSLAEALSEAGWRVGAIEPERGAPPAAEDEFLTWLGDWPGADRTSLATYQWIAVAHATDPAIG